MNGTSITWWYDDRKTRWKNTNVETIKTLLKRDSKSISKRGGKFNDFPLHYSIILGASIEVVQCIGDAFPGAFQCKSNEFAGDTPLHLAARFNYKVIKYVLYMDPLAVNEKNIFGKSALEVAKEGKGNSLAIKFFELFYQS